ncbi:MAG: hypothetical protein WA323_10585 [Candidatus Nitrosopolaris sp.]
MHNITYKPITLAPVLAAVIAMMGATTSVHASVDCSLSNDSRCLQAKVRYGSCIHNTIMR